jgi:uncharacterized membrane protein
MRLIKSLKRIIKENSAQAEPNTIFFLIVVAIVAIILIAIIKPMFNKSVKATAKQANLPTEQIQTVT